MGNNKRQKKDRRARRAAELTRTANSHDPNEIVEPDPLPHVARPVEARPAARRATVEASYYSGPLPPPEQLAKYMHVVQQRAEA